jgi:hypothetical protein
MDSDAILDAVHELKGLYVILSSMSFDAKRDAPYVHMDDALKFLADTVFEISNKLEASIREA